ncbi:phytochelatin synthase family protein [Sorangium sp. So ce1389]|uniref:phytochelatin synthase family protein n=1 Tax=Sorangium sp. So ce1389 TaxID=3133336 RepID=UPI003F617AB9
MKRALRIAAVAVVLLAVLFVARLYLSIRFGRQPTVDPTLVARSVHQEPALLAEAKALPVARTFPQSLHFQQNGTFCGPASLVNVLASLGSPVADESAALEGSGLCLTGICIGGLTLDDVAQAARARGRAATVLRDLTPEQFQEHLRRSNDPARRYIVNFAREPIFSIGGGHHSPVGGYLEDKDLVYVLDVYESFQPWLVERAKLFAAIDTVDSSNGKKRGLLLIE